MKKLVIMAGILAAVSAAPAVAQSFSGSYGTGNIASPNTPDNPSGQFSYKPTNDTNAYAQAPTGSVTTHQMHRRHVRKQH